jgi:ParB family chromosome partitioning protein
MTEFKKIAIKDVVTGRFQPRQHFDQTSLEELAASIKNSQLVQPIVVLKHDGFYELIAGERRLKAYELNNEPLIDALIRTDLDDKELAIFSLIENSQRDDLSIFEKSDALNRMKSSLKMTQEEIAHLMGEPRASIANVLRFKNLPNAIRVLIESDESNLDVSHGKALLSLDAQSSIRFAKMADRHKWTVNKLEKQIKEFNSLIKPSLKKQKEFQVDPNVIILQDEMSDLLGSPCKISYKENGEGSITIKFANLDIFDGIITKIKG